MNQEKDQYMMLIDTELEDEKHSERVMPLIVVEPAIHGARTQIRFPV